ncbi:serine hydrolase domain-containing protein [Microlunatus ginsengisoli]|uniref:Serine hydrolase n=1 Tax=Microlunatus ginsengisoli TaxID=363863 RepID=A0ABP7ATP6_9ACTN
MPKPPPDRVPGTSGSTWLDAPHSEWAVWHLDELAPTVPVSRAEVPRALPAGSRPSGSMPVDEIRLTRYDGSEGSARDVLDDTDTDAFLVVHDGALVHEEYGHIGAESGRHAVLSITKSVVSCVAAILAERGELDLSAPVRTYVPELAESGYADATARNLLDMRSGVRFVEHYTDPDSDINELDRRLVDVGLRGYLPTLVQDRPHGGDFWYRSSETDVLGWVCETAAGTPMQRLMSDLVWQPIGAEYDAYLSCDATGMAIHDGGLAASPRDLARFGLMLLDGGTVPDPAAGPDATRTVVPPRWLRDSWGVDSDIRSAFAASGTELAYPGGWYRNQFWFRPSPNGDVLLCRGIHGQLIYVGRRTRTVCVKVSHWPMPVANERTQDTLRMCDAVAGMLASGGRHGTDRAEHGPPGVAAGTGRGGPSTRHHTSRMF